MTESDLPLASPAREEAGTALMGIGRVASILDAEFGGVSVSKIRFLESRGLINPVRTRGGSRRYSLEDLDRLRSILTWQRRDYLPLDVIAERLDTGLDSTGADPDRAVDRSREQSLRPSRSAEMDRSEFLRRSMCTADVVEEMERHGMLSRYDATGLAICEVFSRLREHGIGPRHVRWLRQAAEREVALVEASVPMRSDASAQIAAETEQIRRRLAADLTDVLALMVRAGLDDSR